MTALEKTVLKHCPGLPVNLLDAHFRRMPESYSELYSPAEIARHLRLMSRLSQEQQVELEVRALGGQNYEVCVVGIDRKGALAAITTALASDGFDVQDLQLSTYLPETDNEQDAGDSTRFVDVARVSCGRRSRAIGEITTDLRDRLGIAFKHLAEGDLLSAQSVASDSRSIHAASSPGPSPVAPPWVVKEGLDLGDFRLTKKIATGGMSEIYLAEQKSLTRTVAVKIVSSPTSATEELLARFAKEAQVLASFSCPYIVQVFASGNIPAANGTVMRWLAMEYLPNGDLAAWIKLHGPPSPELGTRWFYQALQGLQYAHQHSILHRDLKPHNLLLSADHDVKISDFGLMKESRAQQDLSLTVQGTVMGTPQYLPPEQALAEEADERSDIYSLGATFFHLFSGRLAFEEKSATAFLIKIAQHDPPSLLDVASHVPRPLGIILDRMMNRRREDRYQTVRVILEDLRSYLQRGLLRMTESESVEDELKRSNRETEVTQIFSPSWKSDSRKL
ncbi:MAG: serine/threonine-protein kinase [Isosphaeraceae bacterium]|nr:serine/threonine-protein kinase [Isosphaeraceae bacterium]